jgi:cytochrome c551/c552
MRNRAMRGILAIFYVVLLSWSVAGEETKPGVVDGAALYTKFGCQTCHASHRGGTPKGPSLRAVASDWDEKTLPVYLKNPAAAREKNERLLKLSNRYAPIRMLQFDFKDEELKALVKFLLQSSKPASPPKEPSLN